MARPPEPVFCIEVNSLRLLYEESDEAYGDLADTEAIVQSILPPRRPQPRTRRIVKIRAASTIVKSVVAKPESRRLQYSMGHESYHPGPYRRTMWFQVNDLKIGLYLDANKKLQVVIFPLKQIQL